MVAVLFLAIWLTGVEFAPVAGVSVSTGAVVPVALIRAVAMRWAIVEVHARFLLAGVSTVLALAFALAGDRRRLLRIRAFALAAVFAVAIAVASRYRRNWAVEQQRERSQEQRSRCATPR